MSDPSLAIQNAIEAALRASPAISGAFSPSNVRLYPLSPPTPPIVPHILIGDDQVMGEDTECGAGSEIAVTVHVYARETTQADSRTKAKTIAGAIRTTLTKQLTLVGHVMDDWLFEDIQHLTDPSDLVAHSIVRFTYWTTATA